MSRVPEPSFVKHECQIFLNPVLSQLNPVHTY